MFFTPSKPKAEPKPAAAPSSSAKKMTQAEKDALSAAAFGDGGGFSFGADEDDLFGGGGGSLASTVSRMGKGSSIYYIYTARYGIVRLCDTCTCMYTVQGKRK